MLRPRTCFHTLLQVQTERKSRRSVMMTFQSQWLKPVPVPGGTQGQNDRVRYLDHGLQSGSDHDEEDDAEEKGPLRCLHVQQARLESEQQQRDAFGDPSGEQKSVAQAMVVLL